MKQLCLLVLVIWALAPTHAARADDWFVSMPFPGGITMYQVTAAGHGYQVGDLIRSDPAHLQNVIIRDGWPAALEDYSSGCQINYSLDPTTGQKTGILWNGCASGS